MKPELINKPSPDPTVKAETKEQMLNRFVSSRPDEPSLNEEEIMEEVKAVRYGK